MTRRRQSRRTPSSARPGGEHAGGVARRDRLPLVISARLARPSIGAVTLVKSRLSCAASTAACAARISACACTAADRRCSHSSRETRLVWTNLSVRFASLCASWPAFGSRQRRLRLLQRGAIGSVVYREQHWPFFTSGRRCNSLYQYIPRRGGGAERSPPLQCDR